ncbi:unnamed protein product [Rotaria socialis]|uniref:AAA+ ATPase domain-containing protein n=1 Tax=Rotaria socialis TaxID=392032 RepID=A0A818CVX3_9BILA|nr:unnamed protein product [Rotaria socialis]CAF4577073.1 unnamed protein product [Rotaria socialis]
MSFVIDDDWSQRMASIQERYVPPPPPMPMFIPSSSTNNQAYAHPTRPSVPVTVTHETRILESLVVKLYRQYDYPELDAFATELVTTNKYTFIENKECSTLQLYAIKSTSKPIDLSNVTSRKSYKPSLFTRKNDKFGPWNYNFLLNLLEIEYEADNNQEFPPIWRTNTNTEVKCEIVPQKEHRARTSFTANTSDSEVDNVTLLGTLIQICRQNRCDESDAQLWLKNLKEENINTLEHLRNAVTNDSMWEKVSSIKIMVKEMIRDFLQLNAAAHTFIQTKNPYIQSKATLLGDIHRVRRYFHYINNTLDNLSHLDPDAVNLAIAEVRRTYDDDGNVLNNIHNYLCTFCLKNAIPSPEEHERQRREWKKQLIAAESTLKTKKQEIAEKQPKLDELALELKTLDLRCTNLNYLDKTVNQEAEAFLRKPSNIPFETIHSRSQKHQEATKKKSDHEKKKANASTDLAQRQLWYNALSENLTIVKEAIINYEKTIAGLKAFLQLDLRDEHGKLMVKFGRGLLLYGPPGTGKSELLKRVAIYAGITMTTIALAAGELNRPYVGETEKLLIDIMSRANTIPYLICAMTIDEIDGLVPKRDNNAQQSKVDGISVLLSHIEGVKNIPNLIIFGATNRRNMMDEAILRRIQVKCFVGRPSPEIRKKMLRPLLMKDSHTFTNQRLDLLVKITMNFSGAAVGALKSSLIVALDTKSQLTDDQILSLANNAAREFSCWFGIGTLPEAARTQPNFLASHDNEDFSLKLVDLAPTGRILIDLQDRSCVIELTNDASKENKLQNTETSVLSLLSRFVNGCLSRNVDSIQIIDLNFLTKQNAFEENQMFELLTTTFLGN